MYNGLNGSYLFCSLFFSVISSLLANSSDLADEFLYSLLDSDVVPYHNLSEVVDAPQAGECVTFDPLSGGWGLDVCVSQRGAICQFEKGDRALITVKCHRNMI